MTRWELRGKWWFLGCLMCGGGVTNYHSYFSCLGSPSLDRNWCDGICHSGICDGLRVHFPCRESLCKQHSPQITGLHNLQELRWCARERRSGCGDCGRRVLRTGRRSPCSMCMLRMNRYMAAAIFLFICHNHDRVADCVEPGAMRVWQQAPAPGAQRR